MVDSGLVVDWDECDSAAQWRFVVFGTYCPHRFVDHQHFWYLDLKQLDQYLVVMVDSGCGGLGRIKLVERNWLSVPCVDPAAESFCLIRVRCRMTRYCLSFAVWIKENPWLLAGHILTQVTN